MAAANSGGRIVDERGASSVVLDTSVFTNPGVAESFGGDVASAVEGLVALARQVTDKVQFYMPPSVMAELDTFLGSRTLPADFEMIVRLQAPSRHNVQVPGSFLYELIDDIRQRIDRGLRVAEKAVREVRPESVEKTIGRLRDRYREALRTGLLDSSEDLDVILLAGQLDAAVVSADGGLVSWAEKAGLRLIPPKRLSGLLTHLVEHGSAAEQGL